MTEQTLSRRRFLNLVGAAGGSAAVYQTALALGLIPGEVHAGSRASLSKVRGISVLILGAGISGLAAAYELEQAGYRVTIIEASPRPGGRNLTVRRGDAIEELGNRQICDFDDHPDLYLNCGPARIPAHHQLLLHYCRLFRVPLEPFINVNYQAYVSDSKAFDGRPVRQREYVADARGFMTELAAKGMSEQDLDKHFSALDEERFLEFLRAYGDLDEKLLYKGSSRRGYQEGGFTRAGVLGSSLDFAEILKSDFWKGRMHWGENQDQSAPMMQAVGGNDRIVAGFVQNIRSQIHFNAPVQSIQLQEDGVEVIYAWRGRAKKARADYCLNCIPFHLIPGIQNNFPAGYVDAMTRVPYASLVKVGLQMRERFWERDNIYGGISWTDQLSEQLWYPSHGFHGQKGVVLGAYLLSDKKGREFTRLSQTGRLREAMRAGELIHPGYSSYVENGVTVCWQRIAHQLGCNARWNEERLAEYFPILQKPAGRHYLVGDQISHHSGWQEGAVSSAHFALADLQERVQTHARAAV